ncbi:FtsX-like permease family protein [Xanthomonas hyacinthi]|uniref:ABC transporter ATP-binding protein n=1 Tax=Xanthomonas hyacinthi TaxID=56455 RepID=A0A2S7EPF1_9XANT|nr:FtsX-like permease family protein [Xanthomonas hyacinthi]KLD79381.1 ABC transporter ATP-binding protein [Xanthomonas hyacinthi DSM 19077]PPU94390.1 ABC transporter ATP-binding protein [Xanthomonas hyacinthi]QGY76683.1 FtsX-like permease family protein [Xanthomonas hyacinthi]
MLSYYLNLALRSFRRTKALVGLMVLAVGLGIGGTMTALTVFMVLSGDPIPRKSDKLFYPQLDPRPMNGYVPGGEPEDQMTRFDAETLLRDRKGDRQALMVGGSVTVESEGSKSRPFIANARYTSADFFPMFEAPFRYGSAWTVDDDEGRAQVAVISKVLNDKLFDGGNSVGKTLLVNDRRFRILGVLDEWRPMPKFYDMTNDRFSEVERVFVPFWTSAALKLGIQGSMNCWGDIRSDPDGARAANAPCSWLQYWVELNSPEKVEAYKQYLGGYSEQQRTANRFERPTNVRLNSVMEWLDLKGAIPSDVRLQLWVAFGFLLVCLLNTVGLLMAKFMRRSSEIGVRRALGASRRAIFTQFLVEAGAVGLVGGILGLALAQLGVWIVHHQADSYAAEVHMGISMLVTTFALAIVVSLLAGLFPAWRAMQVSPSLQLKTQ